MISIFFFKFSIALWDSRIPAYFNVLSATATFEVIGKSQMKVENNNMKLDKNREQTQTMQIIYDNYETLFQFLDIANELTENMWNL